MHGVQASQKTVCIYDIKRGQLFRHDMVIRELLLLSLYCRSRKWTWMHGRYGCDLAWNENYVSLDQKVPTLSALQVDTEEHELNGMELLLLI